MAYKKETIISILDRINKGEMVMPAIQRKFLWSDEQICKLFDSIMRGYPRGTFLFWKIKKTAVNDRNYSMYEFIRDFHERDRCLNPKAPFPLVVTNPDDNLFAVLDGQQRLHSIYIALQGSISRLEKKKKTNEADAYVFKELYLNLHSKPNEDNGTLYDFCFLSSSEASQNDDASLWYKVKEILKYSQDVSDFQNMVRTRFPSDSPAVNTLERLYKSLVRDDIINFFEQSSDSIDEVLDIFIRVNSGGITLSKSDLLFSTVVSQWNDAREEMDRLLQEVNRIGDGYHFSNDFILRTSLYVLDFSIQLKVDSFQSVQVATIKNSWEKIADSIKDSVAFMFESGFTGEAVLSENAVLPIVYYRFSHGMFDTDSREELKKYFVVAQINKIFGAHTDATLEKIRETLKTKKKETFQLCYFQNDKYASDRTLVIIPEDIANILDTVEKGPYSYLMLLLLKPGAMTSFTMFHQDHMHPYSAFNKSKLNKITLPDKEKLSDEEIKEWQRKRNLLPNLQLLEGRENGKKHDLPLAKWLEDPTNRTYAEQQLLPPMDSYDIAYFDDFFSARKKLMQEALERILCS